jgi:phosphatidate cytidylyltransferase
MKPTPRTLPAGSLAQRVVTAVVLLAVCLPVALFFPVGGTLALLGLFVLGGAWEWAAFAGRSDVVWRTGYTFIVFVLMLLAERIASAPRFLALLLELTVVWWCVAFAWITRFPTRIAPPVSSLCGLFVLVPAWVALRTLVLVEPHGRRMLLALLAVVWAADIGAYFAGRLWGRVKLAPLVSPGKTWEGAIGGTAVATLVAVLAGFAAGVAAGQAAAAGVAVAVISIIGDLTESMFKRSVNLKDSGRLFPGHGGVLDRVDSITAAAPLFVLVALWAGWLGRP